MRVAVVVPFRPGCPHRERAWAYVRSLYAEHHPDWQVIEARAPEGEWCKGATLAPAIAACDAEIVTQCDADVWCDGLAAAIGAVEAGAAWALPHTLVHRLSEEGSAAVLADAPWQEQPLTQPPYKGIEGGGIVVASREVIHSIPLDVRFTGWG